jgi:hypothetical protein
VSALSVIIEMLKNVMSGDKGLKKKMDHLMERIKNE